MERNRLTEQLDILLQELPQLERIIVVLEGNRYTETWNHTERMLDELSQCMERLCNTHDSLTHFYPNLDVNTRHHVSSMQTILHNLIQRTVELVEQYKEYLYGDESHSFTENTTNNSIKKSGRPRKIVDEKQVKSLLSLGFKWKKIAELIGVSVVTVRSNRKGFGNNAAAYKEKDDAQLDGIIQEILRVSLHSGERMITGILLSRGYKVKRYRIR